MTPTPSLPFQWSRRLTGSYHGAGVLPYAGVIVLGIGDAMVRGEREGSENASRFSNEHRVIVGGCLTQCSHRSIDRPARFCPRVRGPSICPRFSFMGLDSSQRKQRRFLLLVLLVMRRGSTVESKSCQPAAVDGSQREYHSGAARLVGYGGLHSSWDVLSSRSTST